MDAMPARHYLVTAIRKDGLLDDVRHQHLSAEEVKPKVEEQLSLLKKEEDVWLPPSFADDGKNGPIIKPKSGSPKKRPF